MSFRIIRIVAVLAGCILFTAGCIQRSQLVPEPVEEVEPIGFSARSTLLRDDATKGASIKTGTNFSGDDEPIAVFGWHAEDTGAKWVFDNQQVGFNGAVWTYTPIKSWNWKPGTTDYYDFLATFPYRGGLSYSKSVDPATQTTTVLVDYNAKEEQYDLMSAGMRRRVSDSPAANMAVVPLVFEHKLCAVKVCITNDSETRHFVLNYLNFRNLMVTGTLQLQLRTNAGEDAFSSEWVSTGRDIGGELFKEDPGQELAPGGGSYRFPGDPQYNLLPPQNLDPLGISPTLELSFTYDVPGNPAHTVVSSIPLKTIEDSDGTAITSWVAGHKYIYNISIRVDGGVKVIVETTDWEPVEARTPGIMI